VTVRTLVAAVVLAMLAASGDVRADDGGDARRAQVVVRLGSTRTITVGEIEDRLAALPPFQRATFGTDAATVRRAFLQQVLIPEALEALGAEAEHLDQKLPTSRAVERTRSQSAVRAVRERLGPESAVSMQDVQKYYDDNRDRYDTPERLQIWRILCKTREEAQSVLADAKGDPTPKKFGELAREHSVDKASNLRAGNIGFISPDGTSSEPGMRVDVSIVEAAHAVKDGDFVSAPVPEGEYFSVVWRRGTIAATKRAVDQVAAQIRDALWKARVKDETDKLVASLRAARLKDLDDSPLALLGTTPEPERGDAARELPRKKRLAPQPSASAGR
jgi:peptidyl-prolyl cis-trans isomerase C